MDAKNRIPQKDLERSLMLVILGISFGITFFNVVGNPVGGPPFTGFMRALGASNFVYGIVMALPVLGAVVQIFASYYIENTGRRKPIFLIFGFIHRLLWIPIALIPLYFNFENKMITIWIITAFITVSAASNSITGVCYFSWMGDLVPMNIRGKFFSKRTAIFTSVGAITSIIIGKYLDTADGLTGYTVIFIIAALFGVSDILCFVWVKDPPMEVSKEKIPLLKLFKVPFSNKNYVRFILYASLWYFGSNMAIPFLNIYMLEYLSLSYFIMFLFIQVVSNLSTILFIIYLGKAVDLYGNKPVQVICCLLLAILQFLWIFASPNNFIIVPIIYFFNGLCMAGFELTVTNLSIWLAPDKNRSIFVANYTLIISVIGIALAYVFGGAYLEFTKPLLDHLNLPFVTGQKFNNFHSLFILSALIRIVAVIVMLPRVNEENSKSPVEIVKNLRCLFAKSS
ncbi:MAG: MFS transporter [Bacillota bacterium]